MQTRFILYLMEGLFDLTWRPSRAHQLASCVASGTTEKEKTLCQLCHARRRGPSTLLRASDANIDNAPEPHNKPPGFTYLRCLTIFRRRDSNNRSIHSRLGPGSRVGGVRSRLGGFGGGGREANTDDEDEDRVLNRCGH